MTNEFVNPAQLARRLCVSIATITRWRAAKKLPKEIALVSNKPRWLADEVEAWIAAKCPTQAEWEERQRLAASRRR